MLSASHQGLGGHKQACGFFFHLPGETGRRKDYEYSQSAHIVRTQDKIYLIGIMALHFTAHRFLFLMKIIQSFLIFLLFTCICYLNESNWIYWKSNHIFPLVVTFVSVLINFYYWRVFLYYLLMHIDVLPARISVWRCWIPWRWS